MLCLCPVSGLLDTDKRLGSPLDARWHQHDSIVRADKRMHAQSADCDANANLQQIAIQRETVTEDFESCRQPHAGANFLDMTARNLLPKAQPQES